MVQTSVRLGNYAQVSILASCHAAMQVVMCVLLNQFGVVDATRARGISSRVPH